ncbi:RelA/SpoT domain-containing protein [Pseudomonas sp. GM60]|uniref:RelA/SpoT domain-containing protein n=1 Tax=Pseudomonas sp. GM60 TaxID=1144334 RepID=UPI0002706E95|nr:RelA/SpoT domain-containing protein [Pseudomonas sp. GM60]EJM77925.1 hypothetical protein PMI32_04737 [Pseudomonas sp. GM60]
MVTGLTEEDFRRRANISDEQWLNSKINWEDLKAIETHYNEQQKSLRSAAELISSRIRDFPSVHSVRWRIKDSFSLLKKIYRKKTDPKAAEKWLTVSSDNYLSVVTDLIGVRVLHLLKSECIAIDNAVRATWDPSEVIVYSRMGDAVLNAIAEMDDVRSVTHSNGYRSIHYIIHLQPEKSVLTAELQVRTIFQEGWSEIDHRVKYPDFSDDPLVAYFLDLFNGLAGSADDMGSFLMDLIQSKLETDTEAKQAQEIIKSQNDSLDSINKQLIELKELKANSDKESQKIIGKLQSEINDLLPSRSTPHLSTKNFKIPTALDFAKIGSVIERNKLGSAARTFGTKNILTSSLLGNALSSHAIFSDGDDD